MERTWRKGRRRLVVAAISVASRHRSRIPERRRGALPSEVEAAEARGSRSARTCPSSSLGDAVYWVSPRRPTAASHPTAVVAHEKGRHAAALPDRIRVIAFSRALSARDAAYLILSRFA